MENRCTIPKGTTHMLISCVYLMTLSLYLYSSTVYMYNCWPSCATVSYVVSINDLELFKFCQAPGAAACPRKELVLL